MAFFRNRVLTFFFVFIPKFWVCSGLRCNNIIILNRLIKTFSWSENKHQACVFASLNLVVKKLLQCTMFGKAVVLETRRSRPILPYTRILTPANFRPDAFLSVSFHFISLKFYLEEMNINFRN